MRKCDQATILAGANDLAHGRMHDPSVYYQFDKTYILYAVCAAVLKILPDGADPVATSNIALSLVFWSAMAAFVVRFRSALEPAVLLGFLFAPAVLLNTLYVNSSVLSSAFLLFSALFFLDRERPNGWAGAAFFFLATGSRADTVLLLPLFVWLMTPFSEVEQFLMAVSRDWKAGLRRIAEFSNVWKICLAAVFALMAGRIIGRGGGVVFDPIFNWKMLAGYTVFGFGAAGLLFVFAAAGLAVQACKGRGAIKKIYDLAGLAAFLLPVLFFLPQLHAPRYFWRGCEAVLLLSVSGRISLWPPKTLKAAVCAAAVLPLVVGAHFPSWMHLRLTILRPELFPSGDGYYPMGGYLPFMLRLRGTSEFPLDHNQMVWSAVRSAHFEFSADKTVDVMFTPMYGYFMLEASLRDGFARCRSYTELSNRCFYADSRSLMRDDPKNPIQDLPQILSLPVHFVSPVSGGTGVLQFGQGDFRWGRRTQLLNRLFAGNEYRLLNPGARPDADRKTVCFSELFFDGSEQDAVSGFYYSVGIRQDVPDWVYCAQSVLPEWMSLKAFGSGQ